MYGLEAINTANGWAISVVGISIVFSGLVTLSIIISQLHRVLNIWENPSAIKKFSIKKIRKPEHPENRPALPVHAKNLHIPRKYVQSSLPFWRSQWINIFHCLNCSTGLLSVTLKIHIQF